MSWSMFKDTDAPAWSDTFVVSGETPEFHCASRASYKKTFLKLLAKPKEIKMKKYVIRFTAKEFRWICRLFHYMEDGVLENSPKERQLCDAINTKLGESIDDKTCDYLEIEYGATHPDCPVLKTTPMKRKPK